MAAMKPNITTKFYNFNIEKASSDRLLSKVPMTQLAHTNYMWVCLCC